ncbi:hypothetical protein [Mesorhizobium sp. L2C084A000]|uniref:hypothetical protein n=1 Tax=Mesorhizobium sp. L2C084A000 TaxID=1287116 RepID=UPI0003CFAD19|nr:hypothetical protein [Mesorhizobium sp. L2C084A000]ESZ24836.1 hypothetical protein X734_19015 [Mesorhizobium sp. L2C084A000]
MTSTASLAVRLCGTEQHEAPLRTLRAGSLSVAFDNGALRYIRIGTIEILRGISFLVRDENWGTCTPVLDDLRIDERPDAFAIEYRATCAATSGRLVYRARVSGSGDGALSFVTEAEPETDLLTNRTGFVVLHPIADLAGKPVRVLHQDGLERLSHFPDFIDPECPFTDVRALSHEIAPGIWATCTMDGDAFEMEDQRNWSDASYKTYVRPLRRPWPYRLPKGQKFTQAVRLHMSGTLLAPMSENPDPPIKVTIGGPAGRVPRIGVGVAADEARHALGNSDLIRQLAPQWIACQVDLRLGHGHDELERYAALTRLIGASVVLEIITRGTLDPFGELKPVADAVRRLGLNLEAICVFPAQDMKSVQPGAAWPAMPSFQESYSAARRAFPGVPVGGGMAAYFTELNRKRPPSEALDYATFTTCPSVHAADDVSVMETLEAIPHLIRSARSFMGELPLRVGPSQLGCRENPYGASTAQNEANGRVCLSRIDPRQRGLFNAAWIVGYFAACAREGIEAVVFGDFTGPFGQIHRKADFVQPWFDQQDSRTVYPAFHVLAGLSKLVGATLLSVGTFGADGVVTIAAENDRGVTLWVANLTAKTQSVRLSDAPSSARIALLGAEQFEQAATDPNFMEISARPLDDQFISLDAYAVARVDLDRPSSA